MNGTRPGQTQAERTALAWRRTALSLGMAAALSAKALFPVLGPPGVLVAVLGVVAAAGIWRSGERRYRPLRAGSGVPPRLPGALALALTAALTGSVGVAALLFVLTGTG